MDTKMKATDIKPDDVLLDEDGRLIYTVLSVTRTTKQVAAIVRFEADAGESARVWDINQEVPLRHPSTP